MTDPTLHRGLTLTLQEALELLDLIRDNGLLEFRTMPEPVGEALRKLEAFEAQWLATGGQLQ